ncbi:MAG: hypothetical protein WC066_01930 [Candidatus Omnitrophota bacterium]
MLRIVCFVLLFISVMAGGSYAGVAADEFSYYFYKEGVKFQAAGCLFDAKVAFRKTLLLKPDFYKASEIRKRLKDIESVPVEGADPEFEAAADMPRESRRQTCPLKSPPAEEKRVPPAVQKEALPVNKKPSGLRHQDNSPPEFLTFYSGKEPFLQGCYTPLCQKMIYNNFGISYAEDKNYPRAKGCFKECLKIDSYFKPALFNIELLNELEEQ